MPFLVGFTRCSDSHSCVPEAEQRVRDGRETGPETAESGTAPWPALCACEPHHDGQLSSGLPLCVARSRAIARLRRGRDCHAGARHRRQQRDLHRGQRGGHAAAAVCERGPPRARDVRLHGARYDRPGPVAAGVHRLPRSQRPLRGHRRRLGDQRQPDRSRRARARGGAAREPVVLRRARRAAAARAAVPVRTTTGPASPRFSSSATRSGAAASARRRTRSAGSSGSTTTGTRSSACCRRDSVIPDDRS